MTTNQYLTAALLILTCAVAGCAEDAPTPNASTTASGALQAANASPAWYNLSYDDTTTAYEVTTRAPSPSWHYNATASMDGETLRIDLLGWRELGAAANVVSNASANGTVQGRPSRLVITTADHNPAAASQYEAQLDWQG